MSGLLAAIGGQARWVMAGGCVAALLMPGAAAALRPALPFLVSLVLAMAMARIDLRLVLRRVAQPRVLAERLLTIAAMMPVAAMALWALGAVLPPDWRALPVLFALAPPIASSASICFLMRYDAQRAVEVTILATLLTPLISPPLQVLLLPDLGDVAVGALALKLGAMIAGGVVLALMMKAVLGEARIAASGRSFDGLAACIMVVFAFPLFDGVAATMLADPWRAAGVGILSILLGSATMIAVLMVGERLVPRTTAGVFAVTGANRTVALYLAALPYDPQLALFVALYQFPIYFAPLVLDSAGLEARPDR
ncbi:hypothetical protein [Roseobacter sp. HKCCA0434]|uniref:hypothetical protein n=1 Tax=Roseobacter sp. HKCCA0434 TaxID=3079297 RepID=UPI002905BB65|nr:hypothetical protein [Roseobacter sp. HKCCA0434]